MSWKTFKAWIEVQKIPRHSNDVFSFILGSVLAWYRTGAFHWGIFLCGLAAVFFIANGIYLTNEAQDYEGDKLNLGRIGGRGGMGLATTGGTQVLVRGKLKRSHVQVAGMVFFALAIPLGLIIQFVFHAPPWTIPLGIIGMLITYSYSNPPVKASYRGLGETFMMVGYALLVFTAYYMQAGASWFPVIIALPRILTVPALKIIREFPDREADAGQRQAHAGSDIRAGRDEPRLHGAYYPGAAVLHPRVCDCRAALCRHKPAAGCLLRGKCDSHGGRALAQPRRAGEGLPHGLYRAPVDAGDAGAYFYSGGFVRDRLKPLLVRLFCCLPELNQEIIDILCGSRLRLIVAVIVDHILKRPAE